jgi:hypothetical protein
LANVVGIVKIDMNDPAYYTVADGDGKTTAFALASRGMQLSAERS